VTEVRGSQEVHGRRVAIAASRFNELVVTRLVEGATAALRGNGIAEDDLDVVWVPGAFELPLAARALAATRAYDAVVCLGAVIRGETPHFDVVAAQAAEGIRRAGEETGVPVVFGVLTTDTFEQAMDRAGGAHGNKGWDAALAAAEMASVLERLPKGEP
jgi:6,7-dimethyl-8-ribityllumazine synthase